MRIYLLFGEGIPRAWLWLIPFGVGGYFVDKWLKKWIEPRKNNWRLLLYAAATIGWILLAYVLVMMVIMKTVYAPRLPK
jgi:hypothetical protein